MLEGYTALGFLAGQTQSMTLSLLVTGVTYRHPGLLAKIVTTLDIVSGAVPRPPVYGCGWGGLILFGLHNPRAAQFMSGIRSTLTGVSPGRVTL